MDVKRAMLVGFGLILASIAAFVAIKFIAALTISVFVYYSTRPVYKAMTRFNIPKRIRAVLAISFFSLPLVFLLGYTIILLLSETRLFIEEYGVLEALEGALKASADIEELPELSPMGIFGAYQEGRLDGLISFIRGNLLIITNLLVSFLLGTLIVLISTYYLLIDGYKIRDWFLEFDEDGVIETYFETADKELQTVLFGNLLTIIVISILAIIVYSVYNLMVPPIAEVPYPALAGALTGVASLVPVVGMKVVYGPMALVVTAKMLIQGDLTGMVYVFIFLAIVVVVVDTIPDFFMRPYLSGEYTHVGLLMLAYIFGTLVFGFYGLFLAPIVLVLGLTFIHIIMPYLQSEKVPSSLYRPDSELMLSDFIDDEEAEDEDEGPDGLGGRIRGFLGG